MAGSTVHDEIIGVGAGVGGGFLNTQELKVMKYDEALSGNDRKQWGLITSSVDPPPTNAQLTFIVFPKKSAPCNALMASCASDFFEYSINA